MAGDLDPVLERELAYHETLYSGFAQQHFAKAAVRLLRAHIAHRVIQATGAGPGSRVLSIGCGIGDTELLIAPYVKELTGIDLSPAAVRQARQDAEAARIRNVRFEQGTLEQTSGRFDVIIAIFLLHHLPDEVLAGIPAALRDRLNPGGTFYALDPSRQRLSGWIGQRVCPKLMAKYQTEDERELDAQQTARIFTASNFNCQTRMYDFVSTPLAGLFPDWALGFRLARALDEVLIRVPGLRNLGSSFELIANPAS